MTALSKAEIVDSLVTEFSLEKKDARLAVEIFFDSLVDRLVNGKDVKLSGFGNFILRTKTARPGRNPRTGETVLVTARRVVTFKAGTKLKKLIE
jgi:integration host factor subunit alpha